MTVPNLSTFARLPAPLIERTNQSIEADNQPAREQGSTKQRQPAVHLYHKQSFRDLSHYLDSSETLPSPHDSIYNAETILSEEVYPQTGTPSSEEWSQSNESFALPTLAFFAPDQDSETRSPHSRWPVSQLEPIIERRSTPQLQKCNSVPRLQPSPERIARVVQPQASSHSIHIPQPNTVIASISSNQEAPHFRSLSLNDLDCFPRSDTRQIFSTAHSDLSSSPEEDWKASCLRSPFPLRPVYSPPHRSPTPPGLPSFSTREAQQYRLTTDPPSNRVTALIQRWLGINHHEGDEHHLDTVSPLGPSSDDGPSYNPPMTILKRMLGISHVVERIPARTMNPRASLPARIQIATKPGDLIQANDGTMIRGRWGSRSSAHGVGQRAIDSHPLTHVAGLHTIDEIVTEIDKACEMAEEEHGHRQMLSTQIPTETPLVAVLQNPPETSSSQKDRVAQASRVLQSPSSQDSCLQRTQINWQPTFTSEHVRSPSSSMISPTQPGGVHGQPRFHAAMTPLDLATHYDGACGFHEYNRREEGDQARRILKKQRERSCCKDCWEGFWVYCCCPMRKDVHRSEAE